MALTVYRVQELTIDLLDPEIASVKSTTFDNIKEAERFMAERIAWRREWFDDVLDEAEENTPHRFEMLSHEGDENVYRVLITIEEEQVYSF